MFRASKGMKHSQCGYVCLHCVYDAVGMLHVYTCKMQEFVTDLQHISDLQTSQCYNLFASCRGRNDHRRDMSHMTTRLNSFNNSRKHELKEIALDIMQYRIMLTYSFAFLDLN